MTDGAGKAVGSKGSQDESSSVLLFALAQSSSPGERVSCPSTLRDELMPLLAPYYTVSEATILSTRVHRFLLTCKTSNDQPDPRSLISTEPFQSLEQQHQIELVATAASPDRKQPTAQLPGLAVFDMDSTLIEQEVIDELAASIGVKDAVSAITESAMRGELDFRASLEARVKLLRGVPADVWTSLRSQITFAQGARELCHILQKHQVPMVVLSGGFQPMADWVKSELGLTAAVANHLVTAPANAEFVYPHLTGELDPHFDIVTAERKRELLIEYAQKWNVPLNRVLAVGDGANDLRMLKTVLEAGGFGVAFKAKPRVQAEAGTRLNSRSLQDLLYLYNLDQQTIDDELRNASFARQKQP